MKRHFREMNRDIQTTPFSVVGVGDMSGDVFGNGMLLSEKTRLIAAFDHRDIFIDPDPDMAASMAERRRLFALPRSSWQDYDKSKLSKGGVIVSRSQKSVTLSPEALPETSSTRPKSNESRFEVMRIQTFVIGSVFGAGAIPVCAEAPRNLAARRLPRCSGSYARAADGRHRLRLPLTNRFHGPDLD